MRKQLRFSLAAVLAIFLAINPSFGDEPDISGCADCRRWLVIDFETTDDFSHGYFLSHFRQFAEAFKKNVTDDVCEADVHSSTLDRVNCPLLLYLHSSDRVVSYALNTTLLQSALDSQSSNTSLTNITLTLTQTLIDTSLSKQQPDYDVSDTTAHSELTFGIVLECTHSECCQHFVGEWLGKFESFDIFMQYQIQSSPFGNWLNFTMNTTDYGYAYTGGNFSDSIPIPTRLPTTTTMLPTTTEMEESGPKTAKYSANGGHLEWALFTVLFALEGVVSCIFCEGCWSKSSMFAATANGDSSNLSLLTLSSDTMRSLADTMFSLTFYLNTLLQVTMSFWFFTFYQNEHSNMTRTLEMGFLQAQFGAALMAFGVFGALLISYQNNAFGRNTANGSGNLMTVAFGDLVAFILDAFGVFAVFVATVAVLVYNVYYGRVHERENYILLGFGVFEMLLFVISKLFCVRDEMCTCGRRFGGALPVPNQSEGATAVIDGNGNDANAPQKNATPEELKRLRLSVFLTTFGALCMALCGAMFGILTIRKKGREFFYDRNWKRRWFALFEIGHLLLLALLLANVGLARFWYNKYMRRSQRSQRVRIRQGSESTSAVSGSTMQRQTAAAGSGQSESVRLIAKRRDAVAAMNDMSQVTASMQQLEEEVRADASEARMAVVSSTVPVTGKMSSAAAAGNGTTTIGGDTQGEEDTPWYVFSPGFENEMADDSTYNSLRQTGGSGQQPHVVVRAAANGGSSIVKPGASGSQQRRSGGRGHGRHGRSHGGTITTGTDEEVVGLMSGRVAAARRPRGGGYTADDGKELEEKMHFFSDHFEDTAFVAAASGGVHAGNGHGHKRESDDYYSEETSASSLSSEEEEDSEYTTTTSQTGAEDESEDELELGSDVIRERRESFLRYKSKGGRLSDYEEFSKKKKKKTTTAAAVERGSKRSHKAKSAATGGKLMSGSSGDGSDERPPADFGVLQHVARDSGVHDAVAAAVTSSSGGRPVVYHTAADGGYGAMEYMYAAPPPPRGGVHFDAATGVYYVASAGQMPAAAGGYHHAHHRRVALLPRRRSSFEHVAASSGEDAMARHRAADAPPTATVPVTTEDMAVSPMHDGAAVRRQQQAVGGTTTHTTPTVTATQTMSTSPKAHGYAQRRHSTLSSSVTATFVADASEFATSEVMKSKAVIDNEEFQNLRDAKMDDNEREVLQVFDDSVAAKEPSFAGGLPKPASSPEPHLAATGSEEDVKQAEDAPDTIELSD